MSYYTPVPVLYLAKYKTITKVNGSIIQLTSSDTSRPTHRCVAGDIQSVYTHKHWNGGKPNRKSMPKTVKGQRPTFICFTMTQVDPNGIISELNCLHVFSIYHSEAKKHSTIVFFNQSIYQPTGLHLLHQHAMELAAINESRCG